MENDQTRQETGPGGAGGVPILFEFFNQHTYVLGRDAAAHTTQFRWAYETNSGNTLKSHGSWTYVFKNFGGAWRVVHSGGTHVFD